MSDFSERQLEELDIDWFCLIDGIPTHFASMGGTIPSGFRDRRVIRRLQKTIATMDPITEARILQERVEDQIREGYGYLEDETIREAIIMANENNPGFNYLEGHNLPIRLFASSFVEMARRGFRSYARREGVEGNEYVLIAEPVAGIRFDLANVRLRELNCKPLDDGVRIVFK